MKTSNEMVNSLFERRDRYVARQKENRRKALRAVSVVGSFVLVVMLGFGVARSGWLGTEAPPVEEPAATASTTASTTPTEDDGSGVGGDRDDECKVHNRYYHRIVGNFTREQRDSFLASLGEDFDSEDVNIVNFVQFNGITREEFIEAMGGMWTEENLDEIAWDHGNGCPYTKNQFLDAIYGDDPELTAWVFAPNSTWPMARNWDLTGECKDMLPEEWPPEGYGFGETRPEEEPVTEE